MTEMTKVSFENPEAQSKRFCGVGEVSWNNVSSTTYESKVLRGKISQFFSSRYSYKKHFNWEI